MKRSGRNPINTEEIFHQYNNIVFGFVLKNVRNHTLARDITQDIFLKICLKETRIQEIDDLDNYIFLITRNTLIDHFRKAANEYKYRQTLKEKWTNPIKLEMDRRHYGYVLETALGRLSNRQKTIYVLHQKEGKSLKDISRDLNISFFTAKNHLAEARKNLRELIDPDVLYIGFALLVVWAFEMV